MRVPAGPDLFRQEALEKKSVANIVFAPLKAVCLVIGWIPLFRVRLLHFPPHTLCERLFHNRRNPTARHFFMIDVALNVRDEWYCLTHRVPPGSLVENPQGPERTRTHWTRIR